MTEKKERSFFEWFLIFGLVVFLVLLMWVFCTPYESLVAASTENDELPAVVGSELAMKWRLWMRDMWILSAHEEARLAADEFLKLNEELMNSVLAVALPEDWQFVPWKIYMWMVILAERLGQAAVCCVLAVPAWIVTWQVVRRGLQIRRNDLQGELPVTLRHKRGFCLLLMLGLILMLGAPVKLNMTWLLAAMGVWGLMTSALVVAVREANRS